MHRKLFQNLRVDGADSGGVSLSSDSLEFTKFCHWYRREKSIWSKDLKIGPWTEKLAPTSSFLSFPLNSQ